MKENENFKEELRIKSEKLEEFARIIEENSKKNQRNEKIIEKYKEEIRENLEK